MQLMQICDNCNGQLIEPKLKKAIMKEKLDEDTELVNKPSCPFCGIVLKQVPPLKIIHGRASRTFRTDRPPRHREFEVNFLSAQQIKRKVEKIIVTKRGNLATLTSEDSSQRIDFMACFRKQHSQLFWNVVYYFNNHDLPYDVILPYKDTSEVEAIERQWQEVNHNCRLELGPNVRENIMGKFEIS